MFIIKIFFYHSHEYELLYRKLNSYSFIDLTVIQNIREKLN